tara:strand:+ start:2459 stop:3247 length:789 start_codon:yes stop_codon:yes gene_type:complete
MKHKYCKNPVSFADMIDLINRLLGPGGCEWDKSQTFVSIRRFLLEETHELIEAITENNVSEILDEIGDLIFQLGFLVVLAKNIGWFDEKDVFNGIISKMIQRHPHIFQNPQKLKKSEVQLNWNKIKSETTRGLNAPVLGSVPKSSPSLVAALLIQERASSVGFDWLEYEQVLAKVPEEIEEIRKASTAVNKEEEFGDLLFSIVNVARWIGINPELALKTANDKFIGRFQKMAFVAKSRGSDLNDMSFVEKNKLWEEIKINTD